MLFSSPHVLHIVLDFITQSKTDEHYKLRTYSLCSFLPSAVIPFLLTPNTLNVKDFHSGVFVE